MRLGLLVLLASSSALAEPAIRIRMAAYAPEGTSWANEFHTINREVQAATRGQVQIKWALGGIAGDEMQDNQLLNGVFEKQGLHKVPVSDALRSDFFEAARTARDQVAGTLVPAELLQRTLMWLADYRSQRMNLR